MFELNVSINRLQDGNVYDCRDNIDNINFMKDIEENKVNIIIVGGDIDNTSIQHLKQTKPSIEGCLLAIEKLYEDVGEKTMEGGLLFVQ